MQMWTKHIVSWTSVRPCEASGNASTPSLSCNKTCTMTLQPHLVNCTAALHRRPTNLQKTTADLNFKCLERKKIKQWDWDLGLELQVRFGFLRQWCSMVKWTGKGKSIPWALIGDEGVINQGRGGGFNRKCWNNWLNAPTFSISQALQSRWWLQKAKHS